jgi:hypothetical protein
MPHKGKKTEVKALVGEIDAVYEKATPGPWQFGFGTVEDAKGWKLMHFVGRWVDHPTKPYTVVPHPDFESTVLLHNRWPEIRAALLDK